MSEPQSNRGADPAPEPARRDVYRETLVDATSAPVDDAAARDVYQERVSGPAGDQVARSEHVSVPSDAARRGGGVTRAKQVIYFIFGVINVLLVMRFVLLLLGANEVSPFVNLIYGLSRRWPAVPWHLRRARPRRLGDRMGRARGHRRVFAGRLRARPRRRADLCPYPSAGQTRRIRSVCSLKSFRTNR